MVGGAGFQTLCRLKHLRQIITESRVIKSLIIESLIIESLIIESLIIESLIMSLHEKTYTIDRLNMGLNELKYRKSGKKQTARRR
ncbi:hypothetical protein FXV91_08995 [Methanosarcina sp. DH2]|jgi:hypothetical protein|uniref:hypothetical protein n=1 Tax=Methanosarcina sp. DH2 TaxID=2605639 RepID=UPI001E3610BC|nr:hypothetical protein [Methanosarcina sp. DH2]MCC4770322.1 hypothetical protein [Methanosarcina sp. DH2]